MKPYSFYGLWTLREEPSIYKFLSHRGSNSITCQSNEGGTPGSQSGGGGGCCAVLVVVAVLLAVAGIAIGCSCCAAPCERRCAPPWFDIVNNVSHWHPNMNGCASDWALRTSFLDDVGYPFAWLFQVFDLFTKTHGCMLLQVCPSPIECTVRQKSFSFPAFDFHL